MSDPSPPLIDYLPPGWTHEKVKTATLEDFESLSEEELKKFGEAQQRHSKALSEFNERVHGLKLDEISEASIVTGDGEPIVGASTTTGGAKRTADERGDSPAEGEDDNAGNATKKRDVREPVQRHVEVLQRDRFDQWGFVVIRADGYDDNDKWNAFKAKWQELVDEQLNDPSSGITQEMKDAYRSHFLADASKYAHLLDGAEFKGIREEAERLREENILVYGIDVGMVLVVNQEVIDSVLGNVGEGEDDEDKLDIPWVWAVDTDYDPDDEENDEDEEEDEEKYPGRFKVAVSALLEELWAMLVSSLHPTEIWLLADPLFEGI